ncbi:MAG: efflux RND transporter periplasmic adaptor subunit [Flavobacteriales bacterium]|jgi:cobalt-zinc-cadmium efflux system membrane fusion protein|nr:efflux RND transporter periplasmic adaptor subunit [Flavobacteriales bacterium]
MKTNYITYTGIIAAFALLLTACSSNGPESTTEAETPTGETELITLTKEQFTSSGYQLGTLTKQVFETTVTANGSVDVPPKFQASVSAYFGGYVKQIDLLVGEHVHAGQVLFTLENPEFLEVQKDFLETAGELNYLKEDLARQGSLAEANVSSQKKLTKAQSDFQMMNAKHAALKKKLEMMHVDVKGLTAENLRSSINILAPINGYITDINATAGTFLSPSDIAMKIINTEHLHLELKVFEQDAAKITEGQLIHFRVQNEKAYREAEVHLVNKNLDAESRTLNVHGHIDAVSAKGLTVGSYIEAQIVTGSDTLLALPTAAVVELEGRHFVLKALDNQTDFERLEVKLVQVQTDFTAIEMPTGVSVSTEFLTVGAYDMIAD